MGPLLAPTTADPGETDEVRTARPQSHEAIGREFNIQTFLTDGHRRLVRQGEYTSPLSYPLRIDPDQRFTCASCARCCKRWEILVTNAEVESFRQHDAARWFREHADADEGAAFDPFEPVAGWRGYHRIRKRLDGACGFLSAANRCRIHEELGGHRKPLTCRVFPYSFHPAPDAVIVKTSFGCPTVIANQGEPIGSGAALQDIKSLRAEWFAGHRAADSPRVYISGRAITADSLRILRDSLQHMLDRRQDDGGIDLRLNVRRMAHALQDLTRARVVRLPDADFAEYIRLTLPFAAANLSAPAPRPPARVGRLMARGFLYAVAATRLKLEHPAMSRVRLRLQMLRLLAHFHRLAPGFVRIDLAVLRRARVDVNAPGVQPVAYRYLRASIATLGAGTRPVLDDFAVAVSYLNAACSLAVMNAYVDTERPSVDEKIFSEALMEAVDLAHSDDRGMMGRMLARFASGVDALDVFAR